MSSFSRCMRFRQQSLLYSSCFLEYFTFLSALKFHRKSLSHDIEVQRLYEEMEQQIKNEKSKVRELVSLISIICSVGRVVFLSKSNLSVESQFVPSP